MYFNDESKEQSVNITYLTSSDCQSSHANPFFLGGARRLRPRLDPRQTFTHTQQVCIISNYTRHN